MPEISVETDEQKRVVLRFSGDWILNAPLKNKDDILARVAAKSGEGVILNAQNVGAWDSSFVAFVFHITQICLVQKRACERKHFPTGAERLLTLAGAVAPVKTPNDKHVSHSIAERVGIKTLACIAGIKRAAVFGTDCKASLRRLINGKAVVRKQDFSAALLEAGAQALPIVSLISFMVGLILAFVGAVQLKMFGAQIFVASLVAIAMSRVMGAIMTGILMAGRTGASYAAVLGAMQVNEETDALETMGVSPYDFLVLPRLLALSIMMPLLTIYSDLTSILGGAFVGVFMLDLTPAEYFNMTLQSLSTKNIVIGLVHSCVFGVIVSLCGCYFGMKCERNASAVGTATTAAVVYSIVWIIVATAIITYICSGMGL